MVASKSGPAVTSPVGPISPVELSTNPVVRVVLQDTVDNPHGRQIFNVPDEYLETKTLVSEKDEQTIRVKKETAIDRAIIFMVFIQIPSAGVSFILSPEAEWEIIGVSFVSLLLLKLFAVWQRAVWTVVTGAIIANILTGALVGEVFHFLWEATETVVSPVSVVGACFALVMAAGFYLCLIGDILFVKRTRRLKFTVTRDENKFVITEALSPLSDEETWWLTWGLSFGSAWWPFHALYLLCRGIDWLTAGVLPDVISLLISARTMRR